MTDFAIPADHPSSPANRAPERASPIDALCQGIVERLKISLAPTVTIEHFPNKPDAYDFEGYNAAALVLYNSSRFDADGQRGAQSLHEDVVIEICLLVRELRGPTGAYSLLLDIRTSLHGASVAGSTGLRPDAIDLQSERDGVYQFQFKFECTLVSVPVKTTGVALPHKFSERR